MSFTILSETRPVSRKTYTCSLCGLPIQAGEKYFRQSAYLYRDLVTYANHLECRETAADWTIEDWEIGPNYEEFRAELAEHRAKKEATP